MGLKTSINGYMTCLALQLLALTKVWTSFVVFLGPGQVGRTPLKHRLLKYTDSQHWFCVKIMCSQTLKMLSNFQNSSKSLGVGLIGKLWHFRVFRNFYLFGDHPLVRPGPHFSQPGQFGQIWPNSITRYQLDFCHIRLVFSAQKKFSWTKVLTFVVFEIWTI